MRLGNVGDGFLSLCAKARRSTVLGNCHNVGRATIQAGRLMKARPGVWFMCIGSAAQIAFAKVIV